MSATLPLNTHVIVNHACLLPFLWFICVLYSRDFPDHTNERHSSLCCACARVEFSKHLAVVSLGLWWHNYITCWEILWPRLLLLPFEGLCRQSQQQQKSAQSTCPPNDWHLLAVVVMHFDILAFTQQYYDQALHVYFVCNCECVSDKIVNNRNSIKGFDSNLCTYKHVDKHLNTRTGYTHCTHSHAHMHTVTVYAL